MHVTHDAEHQLIYISLKETRKDEKVTTKRLAGSDLKPEVYIVADYGSNGEIVGVEIMY